MSGISFLERLLDGVTVEWKPLGEVAKTYDGTHQTPMYTSSGVPFVSVENIRNLYTTKKFISVDDFEKYKYKPQKDDLFMTRIGDIGTCAVVENDEPLAYYVTLTLIRVDRSSILPKFLKYVIESHIGKSELYKRTLVHATPIKINLGEIGKIIIPIPPLKVQAEIVRILDTFTELTAELTAELGDRQKQYNYYRDRLLTFEEGEVEWKTLGDVSLKSYSGGTPTAGTSKYYDGGTIPWLRTQEVKFFDIEETEVKITPSALKNSAAKWIPENCVIIAISGATAGRSAINKIPLTTNQHCCCLEIDPEKALYRYVFHWINLNYENLKGLGQGARGDLNSGIIKGFKIPIPYAGDPQKSLEEQARIVAILDKFDTLTHSIREGLPREIALRQQQYEYYRDLLLTFPKPEAVEV
jgi:type I restriction enzyme, S subunit